MDIFSIPQSISIDPLPIYPAIPKLLHSGRLPQFHPTGAIGHAQIKHIIDNFSTIHYCASIINIPIHPKISYPIPGTSITVQATQYLNPITTPSRNVQVSV